MYNKKEWVSNEVISKEALNNMENGIADLDERLENLEDKEVEVDLSDYQEKTDNNLVTESKDIVGAINELFQSANNGKEIIADAIGEPLNAEDTFAAMGNDIKGLLSTFKTNMMNNGVAVESSDKFKSLIDKIATMAEDNSGKGIQFIESIINGTMPNLTWNNGSYSSVLNITFSERLDFTPTLFLVSFSNFSPVYTNNNNFFRSSNIVLDSSLSPFDLNLSNLAFKLYIENVNDSGFTVRVHIDGSTGLTNLGMTVNKFYAIGVGEEDTTLRDSLASILEEDDMASLIAKVDQKFDESGGELDIISATELPATGNEGQICVITDTPVDNFVITSNFNDISNSSAIYMYTSPVSSVFLVSVPSGNITHDYYITKFCKGALSNSLDSYIFMNNQWNELTKAKFAIFENCQYANLDKTGEICDGTNTYKWRYDSSVGLFADIRQQMSSVVYTTFKNALNFDSYTTLEVTGYITDTDSCSLGVSQASSSYASTGSYVSAIENRQNFTTTPATYTYDISSWTGSGYLALHWYTYSYSSSSTHCIYISSIYMY